MNTAREELDQVREKAKKDADQAREEAKKDAVPEPPPRAESFIISHVNEALGQDKARSRRQAKVCR
jgi:hypothetical protein